MRPWFRETACKYIVTVFKMEVKEKIKCCFLFQILSQLDINKYLASVVQVIITNYTI